MSVSIPITDDLIEAIAARVVELLDLDRDAAPPTDAWLDVRGAAAHLCCPRSRIYDLVQLGKLVPEHDGRRLLFRRSDLDAYVIRGDRRA